MIKFLRKSAIENVWFYRGLMLLISVAFVVTMGWFGFGGSVNQYVVAEVDDISIPLERYQQAYENAYNFYRDLFKDQFNDQLLEQLDLRNTVINGLVEKELWLIAAREMDLEVSDQELSEAILHEETFQRNGKFDTGIYRQVLAQNRLTPERYERARREELLVEKTKNLLKTGVMVTDAEVEEMASHQTTDKAPPPDKGQLKKSLLLHKQQMVLQAYLTDLKTRVPVSIDRKML